MTPEDKELLLKDLCARLPYGVKVGTANNDVEIEKVGALSMIDTDTVVAFTSDDTNYYNYITIHEVKPYLFPLSSMTDEQKEEIEDKLIFPNNSNGGWIEILYNDKYNIPFWFVDFCNKNHLDYRGLIPKGLAIDATGKNIY